MEGFSKYFTFENMTKSSRYPDLVEKNREEAIQYVDNGRKLSMLHEDIRTFLGVPMLESSGFRGRMLTKAGGFSSTSTHTRFEALDSVPIGISAEDAFYKIKSNSHLFPTLRKVILEQVGNKKWLHIEVKTSERDKLAFYTTNDGKNYTKV